MNLPNKLTVVRVLLVPFFVFFLVSRSVPHNYLIALIIFSVASYTDFLDGKIARRDGLVTNFGKFMDPLADKIMVMSALVCFVALGHVDIVQVLLIMFREFAVTSVRLVAAGNGKVVAANMLGKIKTVTQIVAIIAIMLLQYIVGFSKISLYLGNYVFLIGEAFMFVATAFSLISGYVYVKENWDCIKEMK